MKKILCPVDFSPAATNATAFAAKLTRSMQGELTLLNVQVLMELTPDAAVMGKHYNMEEASEQLESACAEVRQVFHIPCEYKVTDAISGLNKTIVEGAGEYDLIVMGTDGPSDLFQFFAGSNTYRVIHSSTIPVLLVPEHTLYQEPRKILYAFDYWRSNELPLDQLLQFASSFDAEITVLQIMEEAYSHLAKQEMDELQFWIEKYHKDSKLKFKTIHTDNLVGAVHHDILSSGMDMLALCTTHYSFMQRLFHKSVIKSISGLADYPVFVFHDNTQNK